MTVTSNRTPPLVDMGRALRETWNSLPPGDRAAVRRCATPHEAQLEGAYWRLVRDVSPGLRERASLVTLCFPACESAASERFRLGAFLRESLVKADSKGDADSLRFRQLVAARTEEELVHRLRRLLQHIDRPIDWGVLFNDLMQWGKDDEARARVCRRWTRDFYTPAADESRDDSADPSDTVNLAGDHRHE